MKIPTPSGATIDLKNAIEDAILNCDDMSKLYGLLDKQATTSAPSARLDAHLRGFINQPVPHLTARVFRVYRLTGINDLAVHAAAASYLTLPCYDGDWYDETIQAIGWASELRDAGLSSPLVIAYRMLSGAAAEQGHEAMLDYIEQYERLTR